MIWKWGIRICLTLFLLDLITKQFICDCNSTYMIQQGSETHCIDNYESNDERYENGLLLNNGVRLYRENGPIKIYRCVF